MQTAPQPATGSPDAAAALAARRQRVAASYANVLAHYTDRHITAITLLYETAQRMLDTGGGSTCAKLLLGLYNGTRFPFDLTDLRRLDCERFDAAIVVIQMDARSTYTEVHTLLNAIYQDGRNVGAELETWAYRMRWGKRAKKEQQNFDFGPKWVRGQ
jgi:hypothetical protein